tara:strand:- start:497 stop:811 length:315 start_codon:yes stop_codon:yes gene_type:complete
MMRGNGLAVFRALLIQGKISEESKNSNKLPSMNNKVNSKNTNSMVAQNPKSIFSARVLPPHHCQNSPFRGIEVKRARADFILIAYHSLSISYPHHQDLIFLRLR